MNFEIERKFLVRQDDWRGIATGCSRIRQAYLATNDKASIRVRIKDESVATLTIKSRGAELRRLELEYAIPVLEAEAMIPLRLGAVVEKQRHDIPWRDLAWEVDVFSGENAGLVIAEIELRHEAQQFELPTWIGDEITGQARYYNSSLAQLPFGSWSSVDRQAG
jgi:adenylate cyclase